MRLAVFAAAAAAVILVGCGSSPPSLGSSGNPASGAGQLPPATSGCCNIFWNKPRLRLPYPTKSHAQAVLSYWAPNGYFTYPVDCKKGGRISVSTHRKWGNPKGYMHVLYWFEAQSPGPDRCGFTAVLSNTGSPPIATIKLRVE
jgi:hypothetical protein